MSKFIIPASKDDLLTFVSGQYCVEQVLSNRLIPVKLQDAKVLKNDGLSIHKFFDIFFSISYKFHELDATVKQLAWSTLLKGCEHFNAALHAVLENATLSKSVWESSDGESYLNSLKMFVYLLILLSESYQSASRQNLESNAMISPTKKGKRKVKSKACNDKLGLDWESECARSLQILMNFIDLDLHRLWQTQLVEDEFISLISNFCYKVLEDQIIIKNKSVKSNVFHLLGCIIKKHNQSLSASLKIVQMMQHFEHLGSPFVEAIELWITSYKCKSLLPEVLRELSNIDENEVLRDTVSTRTICLFIQDLSKILPSEILPHISLLLSRIDEESYSMRNAVLGVFGEILLQCLNGERLSDKAKSDRDQFLDILYEHANLDVNAFVRSKAVQILTNLVKSMVLPIKRCTKVAGLGVRLLLDKSNLVRKAAVQLLEGLLRWNPFAATLPITVIKDGLIEASKKLEELKDKKGANEETNSPANDTQAESEESNTNIETLTSEQTEPNSVCSVENATETAKQQKIFTHLSDAVCFVEKFHEAVPVLCDLLHSKIQSDVLEAISFFTTAWEFKLDFALEGITGMLDQIWNDDQKIRDAVVYAYKEFYFKPADSSANHLQQTVDNMFTLAAGSTKEKLTAIEALIGEMKKSGDIPNGVVQMLWSRFTNPSTSFTMERGISEVKQRMVAVHLLGMFANNDPGMLKSKINVLVDVGLVQDVVLEDTSRDDINFELATHTCRTLLKLSQRSSTAGIYTKQFRFPNDHKIFTSTTELLIKGFSKTSDTWIDFSFETCALIFQLALKPFLLSTSLFKKLSGILKNLSSDKDTPPRLVNYMLMRFFSVCGHLALKSLIFVDGDMQSELKRQRKLEEEKEQNVKTTKKSKRKSKTPNRSKCDNLEDDMGVGGATADDADQEFLKNILETEIVAPGTSLGSITGMLVRTCSVDVSPENTLSVNIKFSASLALAKYMLVSSDFCEKHLRLFFTMLQSSHWKIRASLTIAAGDLCVRFPNLMEPWTSNIYARINDSSTLVRIYAIKVLTNLVLHDMIKVKGHVSEMAKCISDENARIAMLAKRFFQELSKKGNAVYNVMPDIISRLSDPDVGVKDNVDFKTIMKFLFDFVQKDKQSESLVEKLCHRFKATRNVQQWRDLAFCLSLLNYSEKAVKKLIENFSFYSDVLRDEQVYFCFDVIINKSKKFAKPDLKAQIEELQGKLLDHHTLGMSEDESTAKAAEASKKHKLRPHSVSQAFPGNKRTIQTSKHKNQKKRRETECEEEEAPLTATKRFTRIKKVVKVEFSSDDEDIENEEAGNRQSEEDDDIDDQLNLSQISNVSTPIRRKKTPKGAVTKAPLRA